MSLLNVNKIAPQSGTDFTLGDSGDTFTVPSGATLTVAGTLTQTGAQTFDGGVDIDNFNINGTTIALTSGNMTIDAQGNDTDIIFKGTDGSADTTFLTIDGSAAGAATFNDKITAVGTSVFTNLDISGDIDVDGTTNLDIVDIDGAVNVAADITIASTNKIIFNDASQFIQGASNAILDIAATDEIELTATLIDVVGALTVSGITSLPDGASGAGNLAILNTGDTDTGIYFPAANTIAFECGAESLRLAEQKLSTNAETSPDVSSGGLCLDLNAADANVLTLKSSDVAHGTTDVAETDTFFKIGKYASATGGANITGLSEDSTGLFMHGFAPSPSTDQSASGTAVVMTRGNDLSGQGGANVANDGNIFGCQNGGNLRFLVRGDGEIFSDVAANTYDTYDDAQLVRAYDLSHGRGVIDSKFDKFVSYNHEHLAELNLVGREKNGTPNNFINVTGMQRLHNGAIWQQYEKHQQLLEAVYDLAKEAVGEEKAKAILEKHEVKRLN